MQKIVFFSVVILFSHCDDDIVNILTYGSSKYSFPTDIKIQSFTLEFLESRKPFDKPLLCIASIFHGAHNFVPASIRYLCVVCGITWTQC